MVSKAALKSKDMRRVDLPMSHDWKKLLIVDRRAVSVKRCADMQTDDADRLKARSKDLTLKANATAKNLTFQAKARTKD